MLHQPRGPLTSVRQDHLHTFWVNTDSDPACSTPTNKQTDRQPLALRQPWQSHRGVPHLFWNSGFGFELIPPPPFIVSYFGKRRGGYWVNISMMFGLFEIVMVPLYSLSLLTKHVYTHTNRMQTSTSSLNQRRMRECGQTIPLFLLKCTLCPFFFFCLLLDRARNLFIFPMTAVYWLWSTLPERACVSPVAPCRQTNISTGRHLHHDKNKCRRQELLRRPPLPLLYQEPISCGSGQPASQI